MNLMTLSRKFKIDIWKRFCLHINRVQLQRCSILSVKLSQMSDLMPAKRLQAVFFSSIILAAALFFHAFFYMFESSAYAQEPSKQEIQAAMIIKFTEFIEWPQSSFDDNSGEFTIAVLGDNDYGKLFEPFTKRKFAGKRLKIIHYNDIKNIGKIQILIVSQSERAIIDSIINELRGKPILTIGDFPGFANRGGIINFFRKANNRIGFEINMESKELSGIKISSHLLRLGKVVRDDSNSLMDYLKLNGQIWNRSSE